MAGHASQADVRQLSLIRQRDIRSTPRNTTSASISSSSSSICSPSSAPAAATDIPNFPLTSTHSPASTSTGGYTLEPPATATAQTDEAWQHMMASLPVACQHQHQQHQQLPPMYVGMSGRQTQTQTYDDYAAHNQHLNQLIQQRMENQYVIQQQQQQQQMHAKAQEEMVLAQEQQQQYYSSVPSVPSHNQPEKTLVTADYTAEIAFPGWPNITLIFYPNTEIHVLADGHAQGCLTTRRDADEVARIDGNLKVNVCRSPSVRQLKWNIGGGGMVGGGGGGEEVEYHVSGGAGVRFQEIPRDLDVGGMVMAMDGQRRTQEMLYEVPHSHPQPQPRSQQQLQQQPQTQTQTQQMRARTSSSPKLETRSQPLPPPPSQPAQPRRRGPAGGKESRLKPAPLSKAPPAGKAGSGGAGSGGKQKAKMVAEDRDREKERDREMGPPSKRTRRGSKVTCNTSTTTTAAGVGVGGVAEGAGTGMASAAGIDGGKDEK